MAARHDLEITISPTGEVEIAVKGVNGPQCVKITRDLEEALGLVSNREKTSEFYKEPEEQQTVQYGFLGEDK